MKIGILTYHAVPNFGAQLQTLSTVCYLKNHGYTPIVLNWYPKDLEDMYASFIPHDQLRCHADFAQNFFPLSVLCRQEQDLLCEIEQQRLDAILLGSDALFKYVPVLRRKKIKMGRFVPRIVPAFAPSVERLHGNPFFGGFISKLKKHVPVATYAVSSENCPYDDMILLEKWSMRSNLNNIAYISVRDDWTQRMIKEITSRDDIRIYPDPVFAFNANVRDLVPEKEVILSKFSITEKYVLLSFWTGKYSEEYIHSLALEIKKNGLFPILLPTPRGINFKCDFHSIKQPLSPLEWYALIKYSEGYIGELMHPIVVSLHNSVPCFSFDQYGGRNQERNVLFPKEKTYRKESSKIYHIMHAAGFDVNRISNYTMKTYPDPSSIIERILKFDREKCALFAKSQLERYNDGMAHVLSYLQR